MPAAVGNEVDKRSLYEELQDIPEHRRGQGRKHSLATVLAVYLLAMLSNMRGRDRRVRAGARAWYNRHRTLRAAIDSSGLLALCDGARGARQPHWRPTARCRQSQRHPAWRAGREPQFTRRTGGGWGNWRWQWPDHPGAPTRPGGNPPTFEALQQPLPGLLRDRRLVLEDAFASRRCSRTAAAFHHLRWPPPWGDRGHWAIVEEPSSPRQDAVRRRLWRAAAITRRVHRLRCLP